MHENNNNNNNSKKKKGNNKINCNVCLALISLFYSSKMSMVVREAIIYHLIDCDKCLGRYIDYESKHPEYKDIKVKEVITKLRKELSNNDSEFISDFTKTVEMTSSYSSDSNLDNNHFNPTKWQDAAATFDIETLMNLKFFRDLINSHDYAKSQEDIDYTDYYKYISQKISKRVDLLETCLRKEYVTNS